MQYIYCPDCGYERGLGSASDAVKFATQHNASCSQQRHNNITFRQRPYKGYIRDSFKLKRGEQDGD